MADPRLAALASRRRRGRFVPIEPVARVNFDRLPGDLLCPPDSNEPVARVAFDRTPDDLLAASGVVDVVDHIAVAALPCDVLAPPTVVVPPSGLTIPFRVMNLDANDPTGAACRGRAVLPLPASTPILSADLTTNVRVLRNGGEVPAYVGTLDTTAAEWGGGIVYHHDAPRNATTGRYTQSAADRPLLTLVVEVDCVGLAFGATRDFVVAVGSAPATTPLTPLGWVWAENAPHLRINAADPTRLEVFPFGFWPTSWGKRVAGYQHLEPTVADAPVRVAGVLPLPEGGARTPSGAAAINGFPNPAGLSLDGTIATGAAGATVFYRVMWGNGAQRVAIARTPGHVDNAANADYWFNDVTFLAGFKLTIAPNSTFRWGVTPLTDPMVTSLVQGTPGGTAGPLGTHGFNAPYGSAIGTARVADSARMAWLDTSSGPADGQTRDYDMAPHWPKALGWCTDPDTLCRSNVVNGALPKAVTDTWGADYVDTDYTLRRHVVGLWGQRGRYHSIDGNANYNPQRALIAEHFRTAHPFWLIVAISGVQPYTVYHARDNWHMIAEDKDACVGLANLYLATGIPEILTYVVRSTADRAVTFLRPSVAASNSTRYTIKPAADALWCARLGNCWSQYNGANGHTDGWSAFKHGWDLVRANFGQDGPDGTATAHAGFLSDFGATQRNDFYDSTHRVVRIPHKVPFAEGLVGEALVDLLTYCGGDAPVGIAATMVANAKADLLKMGEHAIDMRTWRGARPWLGDVIQPKSANAQEGWAYVSDENGGQRYVTAASNTALGGVPVNITHRWDPALNGGAGAWTTNASQPLTHGLWEASTSAPYVVAASPLQRPRPTLNGLQYHLVGYLAAALPGHAYAGHWRSIHELMLRRTTVAWIASGAGNNGVPFFDINNCLDGPLATVPSQVPNKTLGESWCQYGYGMRDFAVAMALPTS